MIWATAGGPSATGVILDLRYGQQPTVASNGVDDDLMRTIADRLDAEGRPRLYWQRWIDGLPWLLVALLIASWMWLIIDERPSPSFAVLSTLLTLLAAIPAHRLGQSLRGHAGLRFPGHVIRTISRAELRAQRANRRADLKLALMTIPAAAFLGAFGQWLFSK